MTFRNLGFDIIENVIDREIRQSIIKEIENEISSVKLGNIRNADKKFLTIRTLTKSDAVLSLTSDYLGENPQLVRAIVFDKTPMNNWLVSWHQDKKVALSNRFSAENWGPWSLKDGVHHVQPPSELLNQMITVRIHLDDSTLKNGCLKLIPNSHLNGLLSQDEILQLSGSDEPVKIEVPMYSALVMRPHLVHSSSKAIEPSRRRVVHLEYSNFELPEGISWG